MVLLLLNNTFCKYNFANLKCSQEKNRIYLITLLFNPKWAYLENPKETGVKEMTFNEKIRINRMEGFLKFQFTYDVAGFNVSSDTSLLPSFFPRKLAFENDSSLSGSANKIYLP
jgi:hypothetical protein